MTHDNGRIATRREFVHANPDTCLADYAFYVLHRSCLPFDFTDALVELFDPTFEIVQGCVLVQPIGAVKWLVSAFFRLDHWHRSTAMAAVIAGCWLAKLRADGFEKEFAWVIKDEVEQEVFVALSEWPPAADGTRRIR